MWISTRSLRYTFPHVAFQCLSLTGQERQCIHIDCENALSQTVWAFTPGRASLFEYGILGVISWLLQVKRRKNVVESVYGHQALKILQEWKSKKKKLTCPFCIFPSNCVFCGHHNGVRSVGFALVDVVAYQHCYSTLCDWVGVIFPEDLRYLHWYFKLQSPKTRSRKLSPREI